MLAELSMTNLALIDRARLEFSSGFTVFTGETGAGKSILLDGIGLLLGNRSSVDLVRRGEDRAVVEARFEVSTASAHQVSELLDLVGIESEDLDSILITREVHRSGRSACRINGRMATVQMLRDLGGLLVQQHGQHEHQGLLRPEEQLRLLDLYGKHQNLLATVESYYQQWRDAKQALQDASVDEQERMRRLDMLAFQIAEIEVTDLSVGEEEQLQSRRQRLAHADKIAGALQSAITALTGTDRLDGVTSLLATAASEVASAAAHDDALTATRELVDTAQVHADEAVRSLFRYMDGLESDPALLDETESRIALIRTLQRKYGATIEDVLGHLQSAKAEHDLLSRHEEQLVALTSQVDEAASRLSEASTQLHDARVTAATALSKEVQTVLRNLDMPHAEIRIIIEGRSTSAGWPLFGPHGIDEAAFLFSANLGESLMPLQRIASGGELSRTLLALKAVLADVDALDTLVFDEIDVGVSGSAAQRIAEQLQALGRARQVLCVTHSPQVAAAADHHYCIEKHETESSTRTNVRQLDDAGRVNEIARLVGAGLSGHTAVDHAEALLRGFHPPK